jgi:hypothetical protein
MYLLLIFKVFVEALRINILLKKFCGEGGGNEEYENIVLEPRLFRIRLVSTKQNLNNVTYFT